MAGYDPNFLTGVTLPLPRFLPSLEGNILHKPELRDGYLADYVNYTVATDKARRAPVYAAANIDVGKMAATQRSDNWRIDTRIGAEHQLNNDYYFDNPWDRGHLAQREAAGWGDTAVIAQRSADETFYYSNASIQHENFNQDEWLALEEWVNTVDDKVTCFSGPFYGQFSRGIRPAGRPEAEIPAGFFKVVCFLNQDQELAVRAFLMYQDDGALKDKTGRKTFNYQRYQVTVKEIEEYTGLEFPDDVYERNPLLYTENPELKASLGITSFPERVEVDRKEEIIDPGQPRVDYQDDNIEVYLAAALVDPAGQDAGNEWVSILNLKPEAVSLGGWKLKDKAGRTVDCPNVTLQPGEATAVKALRPVQLANDGGWIELFSGDQRVDRVAWTQQEVETAKGKPIVFAYRTEW